MTDVAVFGAEQFQFQCKVIFCRFLEKYEQTGLFWVFFSQTFKKNKSYFYRFQVGCILYFSVLQYDNGCLYSWWEVFSTREITLRLTAQTSSYVIISYSVMLTFRCLLPLKKKREGTDGQTHRRTLQNIDWTRLGCIRNPRGSKCFLVYSLAMTAQTNGQIL